ncbi:uncharacterized protein LOC124283634 isoform X2 [Haliotis rubra]|uniref:uncharacterized protein LOC124283634 isoform X2 n=1 Tax=Haliotis rubra TaxID=36100 RepID=UPI001EE5493E|nr:uncharacterized protein LOC124283634 isoform X2 [Haliotis rubra]
MAFSMNILKLVCILYSCNQLCEALKDTKGRTFSLAFFPESTFTPTNALRNILYFSSPFGGVCTVNYNDGTRRQTTVNVVANDVVKLALPDATQLPAGTRIEPKAIYVNCTTAIALYGHNKYADYVETSDSFTVLTDDMLSAEYIVASVEKTANLGVVATQDNTKVSVVLNATCQYVFNSVRYTAGDTVNATLGYGDVFQIGLASDASSDKCDLGGTQIFSNHQVSVFSGAVYVRGPICDATLHGNHLVSQVPPESAFSNIQIIPKVETSDLEAMTFRVLAKYDNTVVNITKEEVSGNVETWSTLLNTADVKEYCSLSPATFIIQSTRPVMCTELIYFKGLGGTSLFVPGTVLYDNNYIVKSLDLDGVNKESPMMTIVSEVSSFMDVRVNGQHRDDIQWTNLSTAPYTVGVLQIHPQRPYVVNSSSPILVRLHESFGMESYSYNAGYRLPSLAETLDGTITLKCLPGGWFITMDFSESNLDHIPFPQLYMTRDTCVGTMQGQQLIFNMSYNDCHTQTSVSKGMVTFKNRLMYVQPVTDHLVRDAIWIHDVSCSEPVDGTDSVHMYPYFNTTDSTSGQVQGSSVHISLYQDASYMHLLKGNLIQAEVGAPVYVQVASTGTSNTIMVLRSCDAHLDSVPGKQATYPLIADGCAVDVRTQILVTRNSVTRFKFDMFDIPNEQDGIYVTCHVTFCDQMDFSNKCQQQCHSSSNIIG